MTKKYLYEHGLPFGTKLAENLDSLKLRIKNNKASLLIIDGGVGEGKTTLGDHICAYYQGGKNLKYIDLKFQYAMGGDQFQEKIQISYEKKFIVIMYDEAGDFDRRQALTSFNKRLNRLFQTYRAFRILVVIILPNFNVLDQSLFDLKIPRLLINCYGRNNRQGNYRCYSLYRMQYIKHKMQKLVIKEYGYTQVTPNFRGHYLDNLPPRSKALDKISMEGKFNIVSEGVLQARGLLSIKQLSGKLHRSHIWVRQHLKKAKLTEKIIYKRKKYYDKMVYDILIDDVK